MRPCCVHPAGVKPVSVTPVHSVPAGSGVPSAFLLRSAFCSVFRFAQRNGIPFGEPAWNWNVVSRLKVRMVRALAAGRSWLASHSGTGSIAPVVEMPKARSWPLHSLALKRAW